MEIDVLSLVSTALKPKLRGTKVTNLETLFAREDVIAALDAKPDVLDSIASMTGLYGFKILRLKSLLTPVAIPVTVGKPYEIYGPPGKGGEPGKFLGFAGKISDFGADLPPDFPVDLETPPGYLVTASGGLATYDGDEITGGVCQKVLLVDHLLKVEDTQEILVSVRYPLPGDGGWERVVVPRTRLSAKDKNEITYYGGPVHGANSRDVGMYLSHYITANEDTLVIKEHPRSQLTDQTMVEALLLRVNGQIRFVSEWDRCIVWQENRFVLSAAEALIATHYRNVLEDYRTALADMPKGSERIALTQWLEDSQSNGQLASAIAMLKKRAEIAVSHEELDADAYKLNVINGVLDLKTGECLPSSPDFLCLKVAPVVFDAKAKCPEWEAMLSRIFLGDAEVIAYFKRLVGYCLTGDTKEQSLSFWVGDGSNGKSTLLEILAALLGDYASPCPASLLLAKKSDKHETEMAQLHGLRLSIVSEPAEGRRWDEATLKRLTGGDTITARRMREDFWDFTPTHKFIVAANKDVTTGADDHGPERVNEFETPASRVY